MNKMKLILKYFLFVGYLVVMTGCSVFKANTDLITPPQIPGEKEEVKLAISKYIPSNVDLQSAMNDQTSNPIKFVDLDGDGESEVVVFYKQPQQSDLVKGIVLKNKNGWEKIADLDGAGTVLVDVEFSDLNQDGNLEILAGFSYTRDSEDYGLLVYDIFSDSKSKVLLDKPYSYFLVDEFNSPDNLNSLVLIKFNKEQRNTVFLYENREDNLVEIDQLELDPYINGYYQVKSGWITKKQRGLMLDAGVGAHSAFTFVISIMDGKMENHFSELDSPTLKAAAVESMDSNDDGILEYGVLEEPYLVETLPYAETPYITVYNQLNDNWKSNVVAKAYYDYDHLYKVDIPLDWPRIQIDLSEDRKYLEIKPAGTDVVFFDVYVSDKQQVSVENWTLLGETDEYVYLSKTVKKDKEHLFQIIQSFDLVN